MKKLLSLVTIGFIISSLLSCSIGNGNSKMSDSLPDKYYDEATGYIEKYVFSCPTDSVGKMISLNPDMRMLDSAMICINRMLDLDSGNVKAYFRKYGIFYLKQSYDSAISTIKRKKIREYASNEFYEEYPEVVINATKARVCEQKGDTIGRNRILDQIVTNLGEIVRSDGITNLLSKDENILNDMRYTAIVHYFYYLNITNPETAISELKEFAKKYPHQEEVLILILRSLGTPFFYPTLI